MSKTLKFHGSAESLFFLAGFDSITAEGTEQGKQTSARNIRNFVRKALMHIAFLCCDKLQEALLQCLGDEELQVWHWAA